MTVFSVPTVTLFPSAVITLRAIVDFEDDDYDNEGSDDAVVYTIFEDEAATAAGDNDNTNICNLNFHRKNEETMMRISVVVVFELFQSKFLVLQA